MSTPLEMFQHRFTPGSGGLTLLLLHGTGGTEDDLIPLGQSVAPDASLLSPRGRVVESGMPRFFRRLRPGVFDLEDLRLRAEELSQFVGAAATAHGFDPSSVVALGFSNGANIAGAVALLHPQTLAGGVLLSPMVPIEPEGDGPDLSGKRFFIGAGQVDNMVPLDEAQRLADMLQRYGADVTFRDYPQGHTISRQELADVAAWLAEWTT